MVNSVRRIIFRIFGGIGKEKGKNEIGKYFPENFLPNDLEGLLKIYNLERYLLSSLANQKVGNLTNEDYESLRQVEKRIIQLIPDKTDRQVMEIIVGQNFDIVEFLEGKNWRDIFKQKWLKISHYLYYGTPYPMKPKLWEPLPFSGNEFIFWLLKKAINGNLDAIQNISVAMASFFESREIYGHVLKEDEIQNVGMRVMVIFCGEFARHTRILIEIMIKIENGEEIVRKILNIREEIQNEIKRLF